MPQKKSTSRSAQTRKKKTTAKKRTISQNDYRIKFEVTFILSIAICILLFLCNFHLIGKVGDAVSRFLFGCFGFLQYIFPLYLFFMIFVGMRNLGESNVKGRVIALGLLFLFAANIFDLIGGISKNLTSYSFKELFDHASGNHKGGGAIAGSATYFLVKYIGVWGTVIISALLILICIIIASRDSVVNKFIESRDLLREHAESNRIAREEFLSSRKEELNKRKLDNEERNRIRKENLEKKELEKISKEDEKVLRKNKKVSGVTTDTLLIPKSAPNKPNENMHEITLNDFDEVKGTFYGQKAPGDEINEIKIERAEEFPAPEKEIKARDRIERAPLRSIDDNRPSKDNSKDEGLSIKAQPSSHKYEFPPINLLTKNSSKNAGDSEETIRETARKLIETLEIFGVKAKVDTISQGPTVTRFELLPELGTKVSRIKSLSDDIKLNLATSDIRIEAPIPGKAAVGIEIPNKENQSVLLRDLIETQEFRKAESKLTFAVGKDISGKVILYDIDQFPHLLIAGATGSGKSVCINTLIMSLIYKAHPDDVKMIMIDPKVVELSVYNGIPHLLIPVVTDPKKASAALNWAVTEMMERYKKFADMNVRDLKGYNKAVAEREATEGKSEIYKKLPTIVVIVDELADLIMVAKNEVEESICRLAQLARACGIHLIIATQRPSVDVITGLIKANMPSRIAFAVSSNVDSRTILDMSGAEELLGKGDMLFYPKGLKKPVRLQGAFVSDGDVNKVVDYLKPQASSVEAYGNDIVNKIESSAVSSGSGSSGGGGQGDYDDLFIEAARYIIQNNKASIGNLQRVFRIGFNRAARIMDKLAEEGVVSGEEGTKARTVLMSMEQFENYVEENGL